MNKLQNFDKTLFSDKIRVIAGIDEVGRGALAGPVVVGLVVIDQNYKIDLSVDSKKLSKVKREKYDKIIKTNAKFCLTEAISPIIIDKINISNAVKLAISNLIKRASKIIDIDLYIIDYIKLDGYNVNWKSFPKADEISQVVASASVIAKVYRDNLMLNYSHNYPGYGFEKNVGYGTQEHLKGIKELGPSPIHRKTFKGVIFKN